MLWTSLGHVLCASLQLWLLFSCHQSLKIKGDMEGKYQNVIIN